MLTVLIYLFALSLTVITVGCRWSVLDNACRWIGALCILALCNEAMAIVLSVKEIGFPFLYQIYSCITWLLICCYFNNTIKFLNKGSWGTILGMASSFPVLLSLWFIENTEIVMNLFQIGVSTVSVLFSSYSLISNFKQKGYQTPQYNIHFWIPLVLLFFECGTFSGWIYQAIVPPPKSLGINFAQAILLSINIIGFTAFSVIFFCYPKLGKDVRHKAG